MTEHQGLAAALAAFQEETPTFHKTKTAKVKSQRTGQEYSYKYADLGDILPAVRPLLAKHGLSWSSKPARAEDGELVLRYRLLHASGEADGDEMPLGVDAKCKPQELGSAITYARRYALTAQLNLATEEDEDGQAAQGSERVSARSSVPRPNGGPTTSTVPQPDAKPPEQTQKPASAKQRGMIFGKASEKGMTSSQLAGVLVAAFGAAPKEWATEEAAHEWLQRQLSRMPASKVNAVLEGIASAPEQLALADED